MNPYTFYQRVTQIRNDVSRTTYDLNIVCICNKPSIMFDVSSSLTEL